MEKARVTFGGCLAMAQAVKASKKGSPATVGSPPWKVKVTVPPGSDASKALAMSVSAVALSIRPMQACSRF